MPLRSLAAQNFPPFAPLEVEFKPVAQSSPDTSAKGEVHLFAGANGTGKTRLLCVLTAALGNVTELSKRLEGGSAARFRVSGNDRKTDFHVGTAMSSPGSAPARDAFARSKTPAGDTKSLVEFNVGRGGGLARLKRINEPLDGLTRKHISGCFGFAFKGLASVRDTNVTAMSPVDLGKWEDHLIFEHRRENEDLVIGQSMVNLKVSAALEQISSPDQGRARATHLSKRLEAAVQTITGKQFSFYPKPSPKVALAVSWGEQSDLRLALLPDGLRSIIGWLAACVAKLDVMFPNDEDPLQKEFVLLLDEPETHLHPGWQRHVIPAAQHLFPNAQIFVATHSPFVISSVNEGWIYILRDTPEGVVIDDPQPASKGDTYIDAVEDVLGLRERYDPETEELLAKFKALKRKVIDGAWEEEPALRDLAASIGERSLSLAGIMGRELHQLTTFRKHAAAAR